MLLSDKFRDIIKDELLYIFQSGGLSDGKSASFGHISGWIEFTSLVCQG